MDKEIEILKKALKREKLARKQAESFMEIKSLELYNINKELKRVNENVNRLPEENPEPVLRLSAEDFSVMYYNKMGRKISEFLDNNIKIKEELKEDISWSLRDGFKQNIELQIENDFYRFTIVPYPLDRYVNLYGSKITRIKKIENELLFSNSRLSAIITNLNSGILVEDVNRKITLTNKLFCDTFSLPISPNEMVGKSSKDTIDKIVCQFKNPKKEIEKLTTLLAQKKPVLSDIIEMVNGEILERDFIPIIIENEFIGIMWQYKDITTERKQADRIKYSEEKYRGILENLNLGILEINNDSVITKSYPKFCQLSGYSEKELVGKSINNIISQNKVDDNAKNEAVSFIKKNGETAWLIISRAPFYDSEGGVAGCIQIHLDITDRIKMESDLMESKLKAEELNKVKEMFLANMSHEIRTPMNAIIGMAELLENSSLNQSQTSYLKAIQSSSKNLLILINDLLDVSKIESGNTILEKIKFDVQKIVSENMELLHFKADKNGVNLTSRIDENIPKYVFGDPTKIGQVILNILSNAIKFTHDGFVILSVDLIEKSNKTCSIKFSVKDNGIGMSEDELKVIFESFCQAKESTTRIYGGTGLGLSISKQIVQLMGGELKVKSKINEGSEFYFTVDLEEADYDKKEDQLNNEFELNKDFKQAKVLLVEDNAINILMAITILEQWNCNVDVAKDGVEAIQKTSENDYCLILMDMRMPKMGGLEATEIIRKDINKTIPIVALTANAIKGDFEKCISAGMNDYLSKPFKQIELNKILVNWIQ